MNEMVERVGIAIAKADRELHMLYGMFDYSGRDKPYVVRDYTNKINQTIGEFVSRNECEEFFKNVCQGHIAKAAIQAMREPTVKMKIAGSTDLGAGGPDEGYETEVWQSMIDSALNDT